MTTPEALTALADRVEREEPSRELDRAIEIEVRGMLAVTSYPRHYTSSLDCAVMILPKGWRLRNMDQGDSGSRYLPPSAEVIPLSANDEVWAAYEAACAKVPSGRLRGGGKTLVGSVAAAALRARAADMQARAVGAPHPSPEQKGFEQ